MKWENLLALLCTTSWFFLHSKATCSAASLHCIFQEKSNKGPWLFLNEIKALGKLFQPTPCLSAEMDFKYRSRISFLFYLPFFFSEIRSGCIPLIRDSQYGANWLYEMGFLNGTPDLFFFLWSLYGEVFIKFGASVSQVYCVLLIFISWYIAFLWELKVQSCPYELTFCSWLPVTYKAGWVWFQCMLLSVWSSEKQCVGEEEVWSCDSGNPDF